MTNRNTDISRAWKAALAILSFLLAQPAGAGSVTYSNAGSFTWQAPEGVTSVTVEAWGGGGSGGGARGNPAEGGGGAGGQYATKVVTVTPNANYAVVVGAGGIGDTYDGAAGGDSTFGGTSVVAKGGAGGGGAPNNNNNGSGGLGSTAGGIGTTVYPGGNGANGASNGSGGGAGGGGAGSGGAGGNASGNTAGTGTAASGGNGGDGRTSRGDGYDGNPAGGGGGAGYATSSTNRNGGDGGRGRVVLTWTDPPLPTVATGAASSITATGAILNGTVSSNGTTTYVRFDYGTTNSYGTSTAQVSVGNNAVNAATSATLSGLNCDTTYHFRARATNAGGTAYGNDATFKTSICPVVLSKTSNTTSGLVGSYIAFTIAATNPNVDTALTNVAIYDDIPAAMTYSSHAASLGIATLSGTQLTWNIAYLPPGTTAYLTLVVQLNTRGTATNTVTSPGAVPGSASVVVLPGGVVHYRMDETAGSWNGTTGEVKDYGNKHLNGTRTNIVSPNSTNAVAPALSDTIAFQHSSVVGGGFCNAGSFDGKAVVMTPSDDFFQFKTMLSASAWIYPTALPPASGWGPNNDLYSILSNDVNYEFHVNSAGKLYWWWQFEPGTAYILNSNATIPLNKWTHVAITFDSGTYKRQKIYINGELDATATGNPAGTLIKNSCPMYVGGDIATGSPPGSSCNLIASRTFKGMIDETKIYEYELSADEVKADMNQGRLCSGTFDHVRIEYSGKLSKCSAKTVTVKACMDTGCTSSYPGPVAVTLTPTGWLPQDAITIMGGLTQATLGNAVVNGATMTLGGVNINPAPNNVPAVRCFNGATESCVVQVDAAPCTAAFDAVEVGASPLTHLYTKLAGTDFDVDLLALIGGNPGTIDPNYVGTATYDLVDSTAIDTAPPTATCQTASSLSSPAPITFSQADQGRKKISINSGVAIQDSRVRVKLDSSAACSSDNFAVRPPSATLATTQATPATAPSAADPNVIKAADYNPATGDTLNFTLKASASTGYAGTLVLDKTKMTVQDPTVNPSGGIAAVATNVGTLTTLPLVTDPSNNVNSTLVGNSASDVANAAYNEVGYLYLGAGGYLDTTFTGVDRGPGDCVAETVSGNNLSNTKNAEGKYGCDVGSLPISIGRFIPDRFETIATGTMDCPAGFACPAGSGIAYSAQPLAATLQPNGTPTRVPLSVKAVSSGGSTTKNYVGYFANPVTLAVFDSAGGLATANVSRGALDINSIVVPANAFAEARDNSNVVVKTSGVAWAAPRYTFDYVNSGWPVDPTDIYFRATAADNVTSLRVPSASSVEGGVRIVTGRLKMSNVTGSEKRPLSMPVQAQYWSGLTWVQNAVDNTPVFSADSVFKSPASVPSIAALTNPSFAQKMNGGIPVPGQWILTLSAPQAVGSVDLAIDLGTSFQEASCLALNPRGAVLAPAAVPWLRGTCPGGAAAAADPSARATFGIYTPENRRQVHVRELF